MLQIQLINSLVYLFKLLTFSKQALSYLWFKFNPTNMNNIIDPKIFEVCASSKEFAALRRGYPDGDFEKDQCKGPEFRSAAEVIIRKVSSKTKETVDEKSQDLDHDPQVGVVYAWRSALAFAKSIHTDFPEAQSFHADVRRDEETAETVGEFHFPENIASLDFLIFPDPMVATGNTMVGFILEAYERGFAGHFIISAVVAAPEGIKNIEKAIQVYNTEFDVSCSVTFISGAIDEDLDKNYFIIPGLGDFGDKFFHDIQGDHDKVVAFIGRMQDAIGLTSEQCVALYQRLMA